MTAGRKAAVAIFSAILLAAGAATLAPERALAREPTVEQVYQAANSGNFVEAQQMMDEVLRAHPESAKAHYVQAEIFAKQGRLGPARSELATAQRLEPGLPFARPQAVAELQRRVSAAPGVPSPGYAPERGGLSLNLVLLMLAGIIFAFLIFRMVQRRTQVYPAPGGPGVGPQAYGPQGPAPYGMGPAPGGGIGSGLLGGLATGAALGAGMVAGQALAHRIGEGMGGSSSGGSNDPGVVDAGTARNDDMGGNDFGISDTSSWDDSSGGGGDVGGSDWS